MAASPSPPSEHRMTDETNGFASAPPSCTAPAEAVTLPPSPDTSMQHVLPAANPSLNITSDERIGTRASTKNEARPSDNLVETFEPIMVSPVRKTAGMAAEATKPMSPEKAALAAMFDAITMPAPVSSPCKSPRKASQHLLSSPSKNASATPLLFAPAISSPSKGSSTDSASSRPRTHDSPLRRPVVLRSSSPGLYPTRQDAVAKTSTPLSPARVGSQAVGARAWLTAGSSPSAKLSDLSLVLDTTGTHELLFNHDTSFLAAATTAADVTIDDSFDVSRAKAHLRAAAPAHRSSPAKLGLRAKPRFSSVPEHPPTHSEVETAPSGGRGLGVGRVTTNAAGDETIELNLTGSFLANASLVAAGNLMDESAEASLLLASNEFSLSHSRTPPQVEAKPLRSARGGRDEEDEEDEEDVDYEREARDVQKWAAEAARKVQVQRASTLMDKTPNRFGARAAGESVAGNVATVVRPTARSVPRASLTTPTAGPRLAKPRTSVVQPAGEVEVRLSRSGSASSGLVGLRSPVRVATVGRASVVDEASEAKTPMRSRRKSTFTASRPPVSGPARRRESLAAAAGVPVPQPLPPLPSLAASTPGRTRPATVARGTSGSPSIKTPTAATRTLPRPRASLTGQRDAMPTPRAATTSGLGSIPRPRASLTGRTSLVPPAVVEGQTPVSRVGQIRSTSLATPSAATMPRSALGETTPLAGMRKSASQPQRLDASGDVAATPVARTRTLVPRASMSRIATASTPASAPRASTLATPRASARPPATAEVMLERSANATPHQLPTPLAPKTSAAKTAPTATRPTSVVRTTTGGFGFKPTTSAVYVGSTRPVPATRAADENKEN